MLPGQSAMTSSGAGIIRWVTSPQRPRLPPPTPPAAISRISSVTLFAYFEMLRFICCFIGLILSAACTYAQPFQLPTANKAIFDPDGGAERFFVPTVGKPWTSGCFGCVRTEGWQLHEGLDIRCLERDKRGEPTDPVLASAAGTV